MHQLNQVLEQYEPMLGLGLALPFSRALVQHGLPYPWES
jgi:hypothetical protein